MKVLFINTSFLHGGASNIVNNLYETMSSNGIECKIVGGRGKMKFPQDSIRVGNKIEIYYNALCARLFDNEGFNAKIATKKLVNFIKQYNPDIIHLHNLHGYYLNVEILMDFLKTYNKPIVFTLHDMWCFTGHNAYCSFCNCEKWQTECRDCKYHKEYPKSFFDFSNRNFIKKKNVFSNIPNLTIVTPSNWLLELCKKSFLKNYDVFTINNGIDTNVFRPTTSDFRSEYNLQDKKILLGVAARWDSRKGLKDFIRLSKSIDSKTCIVLVGLTKSQLRNLPQNIIGFGNIDKQKLAQIYSASDVFINPTYADNFPTTNIEALACGTPVITYKTGGSPEIADDKSGWVVEQGDIQSMLNIINKFQQKDSKSCLSRAKKYNKIIMFNEYLNLYRKLLHKN